MWCTVLGATWAQSSWDGLGTRPLHLHGARGTVHLPLSTASWSIWGTGGAGGGRARPTLLQAESGVICPTANTTINLSRPIPSARASTGRPGDASALMTSSRDKRRTARHKYCQRLADVWRTWWLPNNVCRGRTSGREEILLVPLLSFFRRFLWAHC